MKLTLSSLERYADVIIQDEILPNEFASHGKCADCGHVFELNQSADVDIDDVWCPECYEPVFDFNAVIKLSDKDAESVRALGLGDYIADRRKLGGDLEFSVDTEEL